MPGFIARGFIARSRSVSAAAVAGIFLPGCAMDPVPDIGRSTSACRANSIAYCEIDQHLEIGKCRCVWRGNVRGYLRDLSRL